MERDWTSERIAHARQCVQVVLRDWNGSDMAQGELSRNLLEESVADLLAVEGHLQSTGVSIPAALTSEVLTLKQEIAQIVRIVDAGSAFYRGLALRMGCFTSSYCPGGQITDDACIGVRGMQG